MRRSLVGIFILLAAIIVAAAVLATIGGTYAYEPSADNVLSRTRPSPEAYDLWGRGFTQQQAARLLETPAGREQLSPKNGASK